MRYIHVSKGGKKVRYYKYDDADHDILKGVKWRYHSNGYMVCNLPTASDGRNSLTLMHRFLLAPGVGKSIDHIDGDRSNNKRSNLRIVTHQQNMFNRKVNRNSRSGYRGVYWDGERNKWRVQLQVSGKTVLRSRFDRLKDAVLHYNENAKKNYGEYARLNPVPRK